MRPPVARIAVRARPSGPFCALRAPWRGALAVLCLLAAPALARAEPVDITDLRAWSAPERTRVVLDLTGEATYKVWRRATAPHLVVEIAHGHNHTGRTAWPKVDNRVREVAVEETADVTRIALTLSEPLQYKHFALSPYGAHKPHRIVLDVYGRPASPARVARTAPPPPAPDGAGTRPVVVVLDAGHGGEDSGAIGRYFGTREKDVVLRITRLLKADLDAMPGIRAELTRRGDYFISLGGRIRKADALHGDLFVSIHADSSRDRHTRGTHVYTLAPRSARDRQAVRVARMENASDYVGGVEVAARLPMIFDRDGAPNSTVESRVLARLALGRLREVNSDGRQGRRSEARFWVLKGDRPSLLVETAFLSNREDEHALRTGEFQQRLARDLALAIRDYVETRVKGGSVVHVVRGGETLSRIATRYGVEIGTLTEANRIDRAGMIRAGDRLLIPRQGWPRYRDAAPAVRSVSFTRPRPAPAPDPAPTPAIRHRVRPGENPTTIARHYGVRLADLMAANGLGPRDTLLAGRNLVVPSRRPRDVLYTVRAGETLSGLALTYGVARSDLARVNDLGIRARLRVGQRLILPEVARSLPAAPAAAAGPRYHTVVTGETLSGLAARYGVSQGDLARTNGLGVWARLRVGQRLLVPASGAGAAPHVAAAPAAPPAPRTHRVVRGETLSGVAVRYRVGLSHLARANGLRTNARLRVGQTLAIPLGAGGGPRFHVVRPGDSLSRIARLYDVSLDSLSRRNALRDADRLMVGTRLMIPH